MIADLRWLAAANAALGGDVMRKYHEHIVYPANDGGSRSISVKGLMEIQTPGRVLAELISHMSLSDKEILSLCDIMPPDADDVACRGMDEEDWPRKVVGDW